MLWNAAVNKLYWMAWAKMPSFSAVSLDEEDGVEAIEWIAMGAVILLLLAAVGSGAKNNGESLGQTIVNAIKDVVGKLIT